MNIMMCRMFRILIVTPFMYTASYSNINNSNKFYDAVSLPVKYSAMYLFFFFNLRDVIMYVYVCL
jgi:hypothetical protein